MSLTIPEILDQINTNTNLLSTKYHNMTALKLLFKYAFDPLEKFDLPEGNPPFKPDTAPLSMSEASFAGELRRLYIFSKQNVNVTPSRKEQLFIQLLESIHPLECKVLLAVKEQTLTTLYPNITSDMVYEAGYLDEATKNRILLKKEENKKVSKPKKLKTGSTV